MIDPIGLKVDMMKSKEFFRTKLLPIFADMYSKNAPTTMLSGTTQVNHPCRRRGLDLVLNQLSHLISDKSLHLCYSI